MAEEKSWKKSSGRTEGDEGIDIQYHSRHHPFISLTKFNTHILGYQFGDVTRSWLGEGTWNFFKTVGKVAVTGIAVVAAVAEAEEEKRMTKEATKQDAAVMASLARQAYSEIENIVLGRRVLASSHIQGGFQVEHLAPPHCWVVELEGQLDDEGNPTRDLVVVLF
jgi:hypothetical protein